MPKGFKGRHFPAEFHPALGALVPEFQRQLSTFGGDDAGAWFCSSPQHDYRRIQTYCTAIGGADPLVPGPHNFPPGESTSSAAFDLLIRKTPGQGGKVDNDPVQGRAFPRNSPNSGAAQREPVPVSERLQALNGFAAIGFHRRGRRPERIENHLLGVP